MKKIFKRGMSGLLAVLMAFTVLAGFGSTTAFAASETAESYMISFPRDGDAAQIYSEDAWGHSAKTYMNGWATGSSNYTTLHCMDSFDGKVCYCIEPGLSRNVGDTYHGFGEDFWDNYPSQYNNTIEPDDIKLLLGRIMQYGYQGNLSTSWRSQNDSDADKLAHAFATQLLVWETVVGERDADFDHVSTGGYDEILSLVSPNHPLYSRIMDYYDSIESSVQSHAVCPSFMSRSSGSAKTIELAWDGSQYVAELADTNRVLSQFTFSASETGFHFSVSGNTLTITTDTAPSGNVTISASRSASRCGVLVWTDYKYGPNGGVQDTITYTASVSDPVRAFLKLKVSYGGAKIIKTSEDGKVDGITFTITGEGVNQTVTTDRNGEIHIDNLMPGTYTVTEQSYDKYEPQESHRVTVLAGQTATVSFNNVLRRGDLTVTKTSEDGLNQGVKFHLFGTSLSGLPVDEYAVTDENGVATFRDVLIGTGYTLEEMDTAIRYVIPNSQSAAVEWNSVTNKSFSNILKKFNVTVTKSDCEVGTTQGDASLAGAAYGIYKGNQLVDTYYTDENGQFTTGYYVCGDDWTIREISPSEGYLLDSTVYPVGAEAANYTVELNAAPAVAVAEQVQKGNIAIIKHSDNGDTQIETPEEGAVFAVYLKAAGSYEAAKDTERDYLTCDENGFAQSKDLPYGVYTVHQVSGWEGRELMSDFDVFIAKNGETYRYLINNANFESFIKVIKVDAETGNTIPYAGAGFQIFRPDGSKVEMTFTYPEVTTIDTFYTNDAGMLITPEKLEFGKGYSLKEVSAPYGYVLSHEAVKFDVTEDNSTEESGVTIVAVKLGNYAQKGIIKISKTGEVFASVTATDGVYQPVYAVQGLAGATYEIKAAADIYTPDGTLRCSAGEVVDTVETLHTSAEEITRLMVGRDLVLERRDNPNIRDEVMLEFDHVSYRDRLHDICFQVRKGEILGLAGIDNSGQKEITELMAGIIRPTSGRILLDGQDITELSPDKRSRAGLFLSFQAPVEIPGVPLSSFLRATVAGREGAGELKGKQFRKHVRALADELDMDPAYLDRELGVGFSGGEKKKLEMLQLLLLEPKLAFLDETDSGLDVDALSVVSRGMEVYRKRCNGTLVIITHNTRILEHVDVNRVHVLVKGRMTAEGDASMIADIDENGFEQFEQAAAAAAE